MYTLRYIHMLEYHIPYLSNEKGISVDVYMDGSYNAECKFT